MFGLMEQMAGSPVPEMHWAIVPTVIIPFALIGVILSTAATYIAGFFGIKLKAEGPRKLLELMLKPRLLLMMVVLNLLTYAGIQGYRYVSNLPKPVWWIKVQNQGFAGMQSSTSGVVNASSQLFPDTQTPDNNYAEDSRRSKLLSLEVAWQVQLPAGSFAGPMLAGSTLFVGGDKGRIYQLDSKDGKVIHSWYVGTPVTPTPVIWNNTLFSGEGEHDTHHARIYAFDLSNGRLKGAFGTKGHTEGSPRFTRFKDQDYLVFPAGADGIYAIDPTTLAQKWHFAVPHTDSEVGINEGVVYFSSGVDKEGGMSDQAVYAVDLESGALKWKMQTAASGWSRPLFVGQNVCFGLGEIYVKRKYGQLACFRKSDGQPETAFNAPGPIVAFPIKVGDVLVSADATGNICAWDLKTNLQKWCQPTEAPRNLYSTPVYDGHGHIVIQTFTDGVYVFELDSGKKVASWKPDSEENDPKGWQRPSTNMVIAADGWYFSDWLGKNIRKLVPKYADDSVAESVKQ